MKHFPIGRRFRQLQQAPDVRLHLIVALGDLASFAPEPKPLPEPVVPSGRTDKEALADDWLQVGQDLGKAVDAVKNGDVAR